MKKNIMKRAWEIRRAAAEKFNCKVSEIFFSGCLRQAWQEEREMRELINMSIEDLERLQGLIAAEIASRTPEPEPEPEPEPATARICEEAPTASGGRKGFYRIVTAVDPNGTNGYAFEGDFLPNGREIDLAVGTIVIGKAPTGSVKNGSWDWDIYKVSVTGLKHLETYDRKNFLSFRDRVAELIRK